MPSEYVKRYVLPTTLRSRLAKPQGILLKGTIEQTIPQLRNHLQEFSEQSSFHLVGVGDVTADVLIDNDFNPNIVITDGKTKREKLIEWRDYIGFEVLTAHCPAGEITEEAYRAIITAIKSSKSQKIHLKIIGEEDLLVLPLIVELPIGSKIVYGQPNQGSVIRTVTNVSKLDAKEILKMMEV